MRKWLRPDWRARLLDLFACFLIPLYTLLFTHDTRWFTTNFSVIAAARDQRHGFFLWGMLVGVYLLCVLLPVMAALPRPLVAPALPVGRLPAAAVGSGAALYPG